MILNNIISIYNQIFSLLRIRIKDKLFEDKILLHYVCGIMYVSGLDSGHTENNRSFVGFGNKICILCCDTGIFAKCINLFLVFPKFSWKDWECHMNGMISDPSHKHPQKTPWKRKPVILVMQNSWSSTKSPARSCTSVRTHTSINTGHGMNGLRERLGDTGGQKIFHDLAMCIGSRKGAISLATQKEMRPASQEGWSWSLFWETSPSVLCPVLEDMDELEQRRATKILRVLEHFCLKKGWESWDYSAWRAEVSWENILKPFNI